RGTGGSGGRSAGGDGDQDRAAVARRPADDCGGARQLCGDCLAAPAAAVDHAGDDAAQHPAGLEAAQMMQVLIALALIFSELSLLAFGGGNTVLPEMQRQVVDIQHWMTAQEFSALFALSQAAPGPNMMIVPLIGWHVAGWAGFLVTSIAKFGPSSILTMMALHAW